MFNSAVIGCGRMGAFTSPKVQDFAPPCWFPLSHIEATLKHPLLDLCAIADIDVSALRKASDYYGIKDCYLEPERLLEEVRDLSLVAIATRTTGRARLMSRALSLGVRALHVEKPLCNSLAELEALQAAFDSVNGFLTYGTIRRFMAPYKEALRMVRSNELGRLLEVQVNLGSGPLFWTHPHSVDLILHAVGGAEVESVCARLSNVVNGRSASEIVSDPTIESACIRFVGGVEGRISRASGCDLVLVCEDGQILVESDGWRLVRSRRHKSGPYLQREVLPVSFTGEESGTYGPISHLVDCLSGKVDVMALNKEIRRDIFTGQRILFGMIHSHRKSGHDICLEDIPKDLIVQGMTGGRPA